MQLHTARKYLKKINSIKHKNWSAPAIMSGFLILCMIIVFSFESLGLTNKEINLIHRQATQEKMIKFLSDDIRYFRNHNFSQIDSTDSIKEFPNSDSNMSSISSISSKENIKEMNQIRIFRILLDGAEEQMKFEKKLDVSFDDNSYCDIKGISF